MKHEARLDVRTDGTPLRAHLQLRACQGDAAACAQLEPPPFPDALQYLYDWHLKLFGRSGVSMSGLAPLSYATVAEWSRLTEHAPTPVEVDALVALDTARLNPDPTKTDAAAPADAPRELTPTKAWPTKKAGQEAAHA